MDRQCTTFLVSRRPQPSLDGRTAISTIIFIVAFIIIIILITFIGTITIIFVNILFLFCFCCLIIYQHCSSNMSEVKTENCQKPEWFRFPVIYSFGGHKVTKSLLCISMYLINISVLSAYISMYMIYTNVFVRLDKYMRIWPHLASISWWPLPPPSPAMSALTYDWALL